MRIDPAALGRRELSGLMNGLVAPRPIAWVSTVSGDGVRNLAPFSFFNTFCFHPRPVLAIGPGSRSGVNKDSLANVKATGELVVHLVSLALAERANACSAEFAPDVDEWSVAGVTPLASDRVAPERIAEAPVAFECRSFEVIELGSSDRASNSLVLAHVLCVHVADEAMDGVTPRADRLDLVGRMGGDLWCTTRDRFVLPRPAGTDPALAERPEIRWIARDSQEQ